MNVLIVEDDESSVEFLRLYFSEKGDHLWIAHDGLQAISLLKKSRIDLVLLDIQLPVKDGWEVLSELREFSTVPVIVLTSLEDSNDAIRALQMGSDDYLRKPFNIGELDARIKAVMRRGGLFDPEETVIRAGPIQFNMRNRTIQFRGEEINFSPREFEVLFKLCSPPGRIVPISEISESVWNESGKTGIAAVKQHIYLLRRKLGESSGKQVLISTIPREGYVIRFNPADDVDDEAF